MADATERGLEAAVAAGSCCVGEIAIEKTPGDSFALNHRDDTGREDLQVFKNADAAAEIAKFDDAGNYRPLMTAPNLRCGWRLQVANVAELRIALDHFYPGRVGVLVAWQRKRLPTTPLRVTLNRQSGMYRVAAKISDEDLDDRVGNFCRSDGGCLRTILWKRDQAGTVPSTKLPAAKYDPACDQALGPGSATPATVTTAATTAVIPLLCQEGCNLLVNECRKFVKLEGAAPPAAPKSGEGGSAPE
jgi:sirohydrochlorin cobaltochelatase